MRSSLDHVKASQTEKEYASVDYCEYGEYEWLKIEERGSLMWKTYMGECTVAWETPEFTEWK